MAHDVCFAARLAHEINRAYCEAIGDHSQPAWENAPGWARKSAIDGVQHIIKNPTATPEDSHDNWLRHKHADGWTWGPVKDVDAKKHPCMKPYNELPREQRVKDHLFRAAVKTALSL